MPSDPVRDLYSTRRYPALSHPETHPAVICVAARCAGLDSPASPESCRILELGCASGHNLLPLAAAYPDSRFTGVDFSDTAIRAARQAAEAAELENVTFHHADLAEWDPGDAKYDYIIAHGLLSWIPDAAKAALLTLISRCLAEKGVASIGYNTQPGWALRKEAAAMSKALAVLTPDDGTLLDELASLAGVGNSPYARHLTAIYRDMARKGPEVLPFDDLAPVCDPLYFGQVLAWAGENQLRYLGESTIPENIPPGLPPETLTRLHPLAGDPLRFQQTLDLLSGRTHRTSLFGPAAESLDTRTTASVVLHFHTRLIEHSLPPEVLPGERIETFHAALAAASPSSRPVPELMEHTAKRLGRQWDHDRAAKEIAGWLYQAARLGWVELRADAVTIEPVPTTRPKLSPLNLHFARSARPVVDALHQTCDFPETHRRVLAALDGTRDHAELQEIARETAPDLDFEPWLVHLAARGIVG